MTRAEGLHEIGRQGSIRAKRVLQQVLGESIDLPFNAYDHSNRLQFVDKAQYGGKDGYFVFDLGGTLKRKNDHKFDRVEAAEVLVEVKTQQAVGDLLGDYKEFLRRAAVVSLDPRYCDTWFIFYSSVPFGSSKGIQLVDGTLLEQCGAEWTEELRSTIQLLQRRLVLVIATQSFVTLLSTWVQDAA